MARRRGFFAELQHQARLAEKEQLRANREAERAHARAVREAEKARKAAAREAAAFARATEAERKRLEKEAREEHIAEMKAEAEDRNLELAEINSDLEGLLASTLGVDDYVDLDTLRLVVSHPPFDRPDLESPLAVPVAPVPAPEPVLSLPEPPTGLFAFFSQGKHARAVAEEEDRFTKAQEEWKSQVAQIGADHQAALERHEVAERERQAALVAERERYQAECAEREARAAEHNAEIDSLIANLSYGVSEAVEEYLGIVVSNSVYPSHFPISHEFTFEPGEAELRLRVLVPGPDSVSSVKSFKYVKASDQITETQLSQKAQRDRYSGAIHQVALRSIHEIFEADRRGIVRTISLEVGTSTISPATGRETYIPFVSAAAERASFLEIDLSAVVPNATLKHLGAAVSKNPFGLVPADTKGVRRA